MDLGTARHDLQRLAPDRDLGPRPLNIVMKLFECNGMPTAKLPDSPGKVHCTDETFLAYLRQVFGRAG